MDVGNKNWEVKSYESTLCVNKENWEVKDAASTLCEKKENWEAKDAASTLCVKKENWEVKDAASTVLVLGFIYIRAKANVKAIFFFDICRCSINTHNGNNATG